MTTRSSPRRPGRDSASTTPGSLPQTTPQDTGAFNQFAVMQSLMEIQKDLSELKSDTRHLQENVKGIGEELSVVRKKFSRAEALTIGLGFILVVLAGIGWWLFSTPLTYIRDQIIVQKPIISAPANDNPSS